MNNACACGQNQWRRWMRQQTFWYTLLSIANSRSFCIFAAVLCVCAHAGNVYRLKSDGPRFYIMCVHYSEHGGRPLSITFPTVCKLTHSAYFNKRENEPCVCGSTLRSFSFVWLAAADLFEQCCFVFIIHSAIGWRACWAESLMEWACLADNWRRKWFHYTNLPHYNVGRIKWCKLISNFLTKIHYIAFKEFKEWIDLCLWKLIRWNFHWRTISGYI